MHGIGRQSRRAVTRVGPAALAGAAALLLAPALAHAAPSAGSSVIEGRYIVVFKRAVTDPRDATDRRGRALGFKPSHVYSRAVKGFAAKLSTRQVETLRRDDDVRLVAPDRRVSVTANVPYAPGEPLAPTGVRRILGATSTTVREAAGVSVAVIDTGIALGHPDLDAAAGTNCITPGAAPEDDHWHGTHVAGTIAARNDGSGVVGAAPGTKTYAVKVLDANGSGSFASVVCGVDWVRGNAASLNIKVANMSLAGVGGPIASCATTADPMHLAICEATAAGVTFVVAAANEGRPFDEPSLPSVPAAYPEVLTTTAMADSDGAPGGTGGAPSCDASQSDDTYATFSNYAATAEGQAHAIAAPGSCIRSTALAGGYRTASGTSMAAPHMAGVVALCIKERAVAGPCAGMQPAQVIAHVRADAQAYNTSVPGFGFAGDPRRPRSNGEYHGFLTRVPPPAAGGNAVDFDGDGLADRVIFRPSSSSEWWVLKSSDGTHGAVGYGVAEDVPVAGDYDGDRRIDIAVWRPSNGVWYVMSADGRSSSVQFGQQGDVPAPGDYDGDAKTDRAVWRPSDGSWRVLRSSDGQTTTWQWGYVGDKPVPGDYDGDRKNDFAVWRPSNGMWYVLLSGSGNRQDYYHFGASTDIPAPADYDGDGRTDRAVFRPSNGAWYVVRSSDGGFTYRSWGTAGDVPVPAYYDADRKADFAVWRPSTGFWHVVKSSDDGQDHQQFGHGNYHDEPVFRTGLPPLAS